MRARENVIMLGGSNGARCLFGAQIMVVDYSGSQPGVEVWVCQPPSGFISREYCLLGDIASCGQVTSCAYFKLAHEPCADADFVKRTVAGTFRSCRVWPSR